MSFVCMCMNVWMLHEQVFQRLKSCYPYFYNQRATSLIHYNDTIISITNDNSSYQVTDDFQLY